MIHVVLFEPDIPQNTGNVARTCAVSGATLHLIRPLGFSLDSRALKRAGLDYWDKLNIEIHDSFEDFLDKYKLPIYPVTTKAKKRYTDVDYEQDVALLFGSECSGLPEYIHKMFFHNRITIPMVEHEDIRSLNLSNSVAIVVYELIRRRCEL